MAEGQPEPKQRTPRGVEIPVPRRRDVFGDLRKVAPPVPPPRPKRERSSWRVSGARAVAR